MPRDPNKVKLHRKNDYIRNKEKRIKDVKEYYIKNKEKILAYKKEYRKKNRASIAEKERRRYANNVNHRIAHNIRTRLRIALKFTKKQDRFYTLLGCSIIELKNHLEAKFKDGMGWHNYGKHGWHVDHIIPCCMYDLTDLKQQKICFHYSNLQPLWALDNFSKNGKSKSE